VWGTFFASTHCNTHDIRSHNTLYLQLSALLWQRPAKAGLTARLVPHSLGNHTENYIQFITQNLTLVEIVTENHFIVIREMDQIKSELKQALKTCVNSIIS